MTGQAGDKRVMIEVALPTPVEAAWAAPTLPEAIRAWRRPSSRPSA